MTDTTQNKPTCCNECFDEGVSQLSYGGCRNAACKCHTTQTTPSEESKPCGACYPCKNDMECAYSENTVVQSIIRETRKAAYQQGRFDEGEICGFDQGYEKGYQEGQDKAIRTDMLEAETRWYEKGYYEGEKNEFQNGTGRLKESYEKGVRDSLEVVEVRKGWCTNVDEIHKAISTLLT